MEANLDGKVAIVTGSLSGIGLGIAKIFAKNKCSLVLSGSRTPEAAESTINVLKEEFNVPIFYCQANLEDPQNAQVLYDFTLSKFSRVDILVNNAGIQHVASIEEFPLEKWNNLLNVNLNSAFILIKNVIPNMKEANWGRIINISSVHGKVASVKKSAYVASKFAMVGLTKVVALELAEFNVTCNVLCPGWVLTDLVQKQIDTIAESKNISNEEATKELLFAKEPSKRFTTPEDIGAMCLFLCSQSGSNITGSDIAMDGGWTSQ